MPRLYEIATFYRRLNVFIEEQGGELTPEQEQQAKKYEDDIDTKVDSYRTLMMEAKAKEELYKEEIAILDGIRKSYTKTRETYKRLIKEGMQVAGVEVAGKRVPMKLYKNARPTFDWKIGVPIPEELQRVSVELDKQRAFAAWKEGFAAHYEGLEVVEGYHVRERYRKHYPEGQSNGDE